MKTALISTIVATLFGFVAFASGIHFAATDFIALLFAANLVAWTVEQYSRTPLALNLARPLRLPVVLGVRHSAKQAGRLAA